MKKLLLAFTGIALLCSALNAQNPPKREFRGAWVATYFGIDWPNRNHTPQQQRDAFLTIVNHHLQTGITAMFVQVRSQSDAMYPSAIEPWGFYLTPAKAGGNEPSEAWDPMQFMIDECHARGIEFHAWINPYRAIGNIANINNFAPNHVARQHPEWLIANGAERIMDPGLPQVREHVNSVVMDIVNRYDIDGIHFDDYFYPNAAFNDDATFAVHNRGFTVRADWRRDNVNLLIQAVSQNIKAAKPWVEFGVSPSGIWRNGGEGSATSGLQHYVSLFADSRKWLQEGWVDYLCPQVYWYINQPGADYKVLIPWWNNNAYGRLIYIGMAGYKVGEMAQGINWSENRSQIPNEVRMNRDPAYPNIHGQSIYNTNSLRNNKLNFRDSLQQHFYNVPALQPLMPWIDATAPEAVSGLTSGYAGDAVTLNWSNPAEAANELDKVKKLVIYRSENPVIDLNDATNIVAITPVAVASFVDHTTEPGKTYYYQVTSLDRFHNESEASNTAAVCTFADTGAPAIVSCTPVINHCENTEASYIIPAITATDNCVAINYSYTITGATNRSGAGNDASGNFAAGISTINWTVTDAAGNTSNCQTIVTINTNPVAAIPDAYTLSSGVLPNTVYTGYAPASSIVLNADVSGGTIPYAYSWSDGSAGTSATVSPETNTTYLLTVTDANGCQAVTSTDIAVVDISGKNNKVIICHKPAGQASTLEVSGNGNAVAAHLGHGDMLGACPANLIAGNRQPEIMERTLGAMSIKVMPNPSTNYFTIRLEGVESSAHTRLRVIDILGRTIEQRSNLQNNQTLQIGDNYHRGIYFVEISNGKDKAVMKLVRQ